MDYKQKYLKYKTKYLDLKMNMSGGITLLADIEDLKKYIRDNTNTNIQQAILYLTELELIRNSILVEKTYYVDYDTPETRTQLVPDTNKLKQEQIVRIKNIKKDIFSLLHPNVQPDY